MALGSFAPGRPPKKPARRNLSVLPSHCGNRLPSSPPNTNNNPNIYNPSDDFGSAQIVVTQLGARQRWDRIFTSVLDCARPASSFSIDLRNDTLHKNSSMEVHSVEYSTPNTMSLEISRLSKRPLSESSKNAYSNNEVLLCENPIFRSYNPNRKLKRNRNNHNEETFSNSSESNNVQKPRSASNYQQPQTPDHPPPSSRQAEQTIYEHIKSLRKESNKISTEVLKKKILRNSSTSPAKNIDVAPHISLSSLLRYQTRALSFDNNVPQSDAQKQIPGTLDIAPMNHQHKDGIRESLTKDILNRIGSVVDKSEIDYLHDDNGMLCPFNTDDARKKICEIIESFGSGILNPNTSHSWNISLDVDDLYFPAERHEIVVRLRAFGLLHLERLLFENGFDNFKFLNGVIEESDLKLLQISCTDAMKLMDFIKTLPGAEFDQQILSKVEQISETTKSEVDDNQSVSSLHEWLHSIDLPQYFECFQKHFYTTIDSVYGVWDVELQTVLEINKLGHRRRILKSLNCIQKLRGETN